MDWRHGSSNRASALAKPEALTSNPVYQKKKKIFALIELILYRMEDGQ
jgi:hypothetical protein